MALRAGLGFVPSLTTCAMTEVSKSRTAVFPQSYASCEDAFVIVYPSGTSL